MSKAVWRRVRGRYRPENIKAIARRLVMGYLNDQGAVREFYDDNEEALQIAIERELGYAFKAGRARKPKRPLP